MGKGGLSKTFPMDIVGHGYNPPNRFVRSLAPLITQPLCIKPHHSARRPHGDLPTHGFSLSSNTLRCPPTQGIQGSSLFIHRPAALPPTPTPPWAQPTLTQNPAFHPRKPLPQPISCSIRVLTSCVILPLSSVFFHPALPVTFLSGVTQVKIQSVFPSHLLTFSNHHPPQVSQHYITMQTHQSNNPPMFVLH